VRRSEDRSEAWFQSAIVRLLITERFAEAAMVFFGIHEAHLAVRGIVDSLGADSEARLHARLCELLSALAYLDATPLVREAGRMQRAIDHLA
jgi:hypothetical protein